LPNYLLEYLRRHTPVHLHNLLDDPETTFEALQLDALCPVELAMLIEDGTDEVISDATYEAWTCLADLVLASVSCNA